MELLRTAKRIISNATPANWLAISEAPSYKVRTHWIETFPRGIKIPRACLAYNMTTGVATNAPCPYCNTYSVSGFSYITYDEFHSSPVSIPQSVANKIHDGFRTTLDAFYDTHAPNRSRANNFSIKSKSVMGMARDIEVVPLFYSSNHFGIAPELLVLPTVEEANAECVAMMAGFVNELPTLIETGKLADHLVSSPREDLNWLLDYVDIRYCGEVVTHIAYNIVRTENEEYSMWFSRDTSQLTITPRS